MKTQQNAPERAQFPLDHLPPSETSNLLHPPIFFIFPSLCASAFYILTFLPACGGTRGGAEAHGCRAFRKKGEFGLILLSPRALSTIPFVTKCSNLLEFLLPPLFFTCYPLSLCVSASLRFMLPFFLNAEPHTRRAIILHATMNPGLPRAKTSPEPPRSPKTHGKLSILRNCRPLLALITVPVTNIILPEFTCREGDSYKRNKQWLVGWQEWR